MMPAKQPKRDKREEPPIVIADPNGPNRNPSLTESFGVGMQAFETIGGVVEVAVMSRDIATPPKAHVKIAAIMDGRDNLDLLGDLSPGDGVLITRQEMQTLKSIRNPADLVKCRPAQELGLPVTDPL